jgi:hypothetical protein
VPTLDETCARVRRYEGMRRLVQLDMQAPALQPGSPGAVARGCTCPATDLPETGWLSDQPAFRADWNCPLHGLRALFLDDVIVDDKCSTEEPPGRKLNGATLHPRRH